MKDWLPECEQRLTEGLSILGVSIPDVAEKRLLMYLQLLNRWNHAYNLTAIRDPLEMVGRHLLDSLAVLPYIRGEQLLDVGTGAGLPGIPLAIAHPETTFVLLDSNGKKVRFIRQAVMELGLTNVQPLQQRLEQIKPDRLFDQITARAFDNLSILWKSTKPLLVPEGELLAMKGTFDTIVGETNQIQSEIPSIVPLKVPFLGNEQRHVVVFRRDGK